MSVAIVMTTRETADLFAGSHRLLAAAKALLDARPDTPEHWLELSFAVTECEGRQP